MVKRTSITVSAPPKHPDVLDIRDAMQQVLDFFELLTDEGEGDVVWNLATATTNSPLTVVGEPIDLRTLAGAYAAVAPRIAAVERGFQRVRRGEELGDELPESKREIMKRMVRRASNGLGLTDIALTGVAESITIDPGFAANYFKKVEQYSDTLYDYLYRRIARRSMVC